MLFSKNTLLWLATLPLTLAVDCSATNAIDWPTSSGGSGSGSGGGDVCNELCGNRESCLELCSGTSGVIGKRRRQIQSRATLTCADAETCFKYVDGSFLCFDTDTGYVHDDEGSSGNIYTGNGVFTLANGQVTTIGGILGGSSTIAGGPGSTSISGSSFTPASSTPSSGLPTSVGSRGPLSSTPVSGPSSGPTSRATSGTTNTPVPSGTTSGSGTVTVATTSASSTPGSGVGRLNGNGILLGALGLGVVVFGGVAV